MPAGKRGGRSADPETRRTRRDLRRVDYFGTTPAGRPGGTMIPMLQPSAFAATGVAVMPA
jgi:hypothetical protein